MENGKIVKARLEKDAIFEEKVNENLNRKTFTMPALKEGSVIEYIYTVKSEFYYILPEWEFQRDIPVVWSEYRATVPEFFIFKQDSQGYESYHLHTQDEGRESFPVRYEGQNAVGSGFGGNTRTPGGIEMVEAKTTKYRWVMKDVPALQEEPYITTIKDYVAKIEFEITGTKFGAVPKTFRQTWADLSKRLLEREDWGKQLNRTGFVKAEIQGIKAKYTDPAERAAAICAFVKKTMKWDGKERLYPESTLKKAYENRSGNSAPVPSLKNANAVVRRHETIFTVKSAGEATEKVLYAITILNENATDEAVLRVYYDKLNKVSYVRGAIYDGQGNLIDKLSKSDIKDVSPFDGSNLVTDNRQKVAQFSRNQYLYTVEFEYETVSNNLMFYPVFFPQSDWNVSVERANLQVVMPINLALRYKEVNMSKKVTVTRDENKQIFNWEASDVIALQKEVLSPPLSSLVPAVYTAPSQFEVQGYAGDMTSWKGLGDWINKLNAGRDQLPEELKEKVIQLTAKENDPINKVRKVYEYLQSSTRYVSIQLGIGGWQPFDALTVHKTSYGDCKALSNYTKAILKAIGIESHYTLIRAGENKQDLDVNFPLAHFNHATLCVPLKNDTIWLECMDQTRAFGYAGDFTGNRHALAITPEGGKIVRTPVYKAADNREEHGADVQLDIQGNATADVSSLYTGLQQDDISAFVMGRMTPDEQKKWLYKRLSIPNFDINQFAFTEKKDRIPSVSEKLQLSIRHYAARSGKRVFLPLNLLSAWNSVPAKSDYRRTDLVLKMPFVDTDTIRYHLLEGYQVESQPENVEFTSQFGHYQASVKIDGRTVTYIRRNEMKEGRFPKTAFNEYAEYCKKIAKADKMQMVLISSSLAEK